MYAHIEGIVSEKGSDGVVIDVQGIGYQLNVSAFTQSALPAVGERFKLYTWLSVREDALELFGFATREERTMFERLKGVTGIGPKTALGILSAMDVRTLSIALVTSDVTALSRAPGIGKKTAQRLVLELKDHIDDQMLTGTAPVAVGARPTAHPGVEEAVEALMALGYPSAEAVTAVERVKDQTDDVSELIRLALKGMMA